MGMSCAGTVALGHNIQWKAFQAMNWRWGLRLSRMRCQTTTLCAYRASILQYPHGVDIENRAVWTCNLSSLMQKVTPAIMMLFFLLTPYRANNRGLGDLLYLDPSTDLPFRRSLRKAIAAGDSLVC
jgi:hypothetical protein